MNLYVKKSEKIGATFLGKGIVGHPEWGVVVEVRDVTFDQKDVFGDWEGTEFTQTWCRTDNGFTFDAARLGGDILIENYAPNWRAETKGAWS